MGKTTYSGHLSRTLGIPRRSTDEAILQNVWVTQSALVADWFDQPGPWIIEGTPVIRALRKWLQRNPTGQPCDTLYWSDTPHAVLNNGQEAMRRGCRTIYDEIRAELVRRGVTAESF